MALNHLSKKTLLKLLEKRMDKLPGKLTNQAGSLIIDCLVDSLCLGRQVSLRGFGRFIPRYYSEQSNKKIGLLFHPSPKLASRINSKKSS
jgi:nucleoid DNA-binding protein